MLPNFEPKNKKCITPDFFHIIFGETLISGFHNDTNIGYPLGTVAEKKEFSLFTNLKFCQKLPCLSFFNSHF
jgi:hypothetical protein